jgi:hypothetical protein
MEEWKPIEDYENYEISNLGNVRNKKKNKLLTPQINIYGYYRITLRNNIQKKHYFIHRLIAIAFIPNPDNLPEIDHIDRNKLNNSLDNLRWVSRNQNGYNINMKTQNSTSKFRGVCWDKSRNKFKVGIRLNGKSKHIGMYLTEEEGAVAYNEAIKKYNLEDFIKPNIL